MRTSTSIATLSVVTALSAALCGQAVAKPVTAQAASCQRQAAHQHLTGSRKTAFISTCIKGTGHPMRPTAPTTSSREAQAITKPSGVDRTVRSKQCNDEADRRHLADKERKAFRLSCLATAGPVSEGETGTQAPRPAHQIEGIGENNYKPGAAPPKSEPKR